MKRSRRSGLSRLATCTTSISTKRLGCSAAGSVRLSVGAGAFALYQFDRREVLRYTLRDRLSALVQNALVPHNDREMAGFVPIGDLFKGRHSKLSLRDLVRMMADRGVGVTHTTILRWVQRYLPEFEKRWRRYARSVGGSWRMDGTYIKVRGNGFICTVPSTKRQTVDFFLSRNRDVNAAKAFLEAR